MTDKKLAFGHTPYRMLKQYSDICISYSCALRRRSSPLPQPRSLRYLKPLTPGHKGQFDLWVTIVCLPQFSHATHLSTRPKG